MLRQKWDRAQREGKVPADPEARRVLENWYYAVAYYWGRRSEEYLRKIYSHIERRPGALQQLLRRSVKITIPSEVIPGFTFGDKFLAHPDNRIEDKDGRVVRVETHLGTIGDPETLAQLDVLMTRARRAQERGQIKKAVGYLQRVLEAGLDTEHQGQARAMLREVEAAAAAQLAEARALIERGDTAAAKRALRRLVKECEGLAVAEQAQAELDGLQSGGKPDGG